MKRNIIKSFLVAVLCGNLAFSAFAATSLFSNYGQIQNVQKYSSNPFWTPNAPYNQRMPQPVYVQGADLNTEDCMSVVQSLVYVQCAARNNCKGTSLSEVRPTIMVQLSNLPGNNYVSACGGYIDGIFESYVAQFSDSVPNHSVAFPGGTVQNPDINNTDYQIKNPYKQTVPKWQQEINERAQELKELQEQNAADSSDLSAADFPMTADDLSFSENMVNLAAGYTLYKDTSAYKPINVIKQQAQSDDNHKPETPAPAQNSKKKSGKYTPREIEEPVQAPRDKTLVQQPVMPQEMPVIKEDPEVREALKELRKKNPITTYNIFNDHFEVFFDGRTVNGLSICTGDEAEYGQSKPAKQWEKKHGQHCWCMATVEESGKQKASSDWFYLYDYTEKQNANNKKGNYCVTYCLSHCAEEVMKQGDFYNYLYGEK